MGTDGDLWCGTCGRQIVPGLDDPLHCAGCGGEISSAEAIASRREHGRYLCRECMGEEPE